MQKISKESRTLDRNSQSCINSYRGIYSLSYNACVCACVCVREHGNLVNNHPQCSVRSDSNLSLVITRGRSPCLAKPVCELSMAPKESLASLLAQRGAVRAGSPGLCTYSFNSPSFFKASLLCSSWMPFGEILTLTHGGRGSLSLLWPW